MPTTILYNGPIYTLDPAQPPLTDPAMPPSDETIIFDPTRRGDEPMVRTTVATATRSPRASSSADALLALARHSQRQERAA